MNKVLNVLKTVFTWLLVVLAVAMMIFTVFSVNTFDKTDRDIFGYKMFIVLTDSMSKTDFNAGDLVIVKEVDAKTLVEGDIISFTSTNVENYGETVTHKIRKVTTDEMGRLSFITYGTTTDTDDRVPVVYPYVLGKYEFAIPKVGTFFQFLKTPAGYIACIFLPFLLLIMVQFINGIRLFRKYKSEQLAEVEAQKEIERQEMAAERERLEEERKRSEEMMAELMKMREQMAQMQTGSAPTNTKETSEKPKFETDGE